MNGTVRYRYCDRLGVIRLKRVCVRRQIIPPIPLAARLADNDRNGTIAGCNGRSHARSSGIQVPACYWRIHSHRSGIGVAHLHWRHCAHSPGIQPVRWNGYGHRRFNRNGHRRFNRNGHRHRRFNRNGHRHRRFNRHRNGHHVVRVTEWDHPHITRRLRHHDRNWHCV